jgi:large conductance mechanosensitive channel
MPPIGLARGMVDFSNLFVRLPGGSTAPPPYASLAAAKAAGAVTLNYGAFINNVVGFVIVAAAIFMMVKVMNRLYAQPAPPTASTKPCPECTLSIPIPAKRCPNCTAVIA